MIWSELPLIVQWAIIFFAARYVIQTIVLVVFAIIHLWTNNLDSLCTNLKGLLMASTVVEVVELPKKFKVYFERETKS